MGGCHANHAHVKHVEEGAGKQIKRLYRVDHLPIGRGSTSSVFKGRSIDDPSIYVAIKAFKKYNLSPNELRAIQEEVRVLSKLDHPNIVKYFDTYSDKKHMFIVMEYVQGSTLAHKLTTNYKNYTELEAATIMHQLV